MHLVCGLGNPDRRYAKNRHNVGFMVADAFARAEALPEFREKFSGVWTRGEALGDAVAVLKPMTYMNLSGESVQPAAAFLKVAPPDIVVVHDELDLPWGEVRVKVGGGHAGHNGLRSIMQRLGTGDFVRVRVGISRPPPGYSGEVADYVLTDFDPMEHAELPGVIDRAVAALRSFLRDGPVAAMNGTNQRKKPKKNGQKEPENG